MSESADGDTASPPDEAIESSSKTHSRGRWFVLPIAAVMWGAGMICIQQLLKLPFAVGVVATVAVIILPWKLKAVRQVLGAGAIPLAIAIAWLLILQPRHDREWWPETSVLPNFDRDGSVVEIDGYRDFDWRSETDFEVRWRKLSVDLDELRSLDLIVEPPEGVNASWFAHTMLSFGFSDGQHVVVSVEARKETGEEYGLLPGLCRQFELIYLVGSERDFMGVRAVHRRHKVFVFPIAADQEYMRVLFIDLIETANTLHEKPRFYNSVGSNCTTTLVRHADTWHDNPLGLHPKTLMPAKVGELLHARGLIKTDLGYINAAAHFEWGERMRQAYKGDDFSRHIRQSK
jgi:hypothetical protein